MQAEINSLLVALALLFAACSQGQQQSAEEILKDPQMQDSIMTIICNDHQMMTNMMEHMMDNEHAMQMMMENKNMIQHMMGNRHMMTNMIMQDSTTSNMMMGNLMQMMEQDSVFCNRMTGMMKGNRHMMDMMRQQGMKMGEGKEQERMHMQMHQDGNMH